MSVNGNGKHRRSATVDELSGKGLIDADLGGGVIKQRIAGRVKDDPAVFAPSCFFKGTNARSLFTASPREIGRISDGTS